MNHFCPQPDGVSLHATDSRYHGARKADLRWRFELTENLVEIVLSGHPTFKEWRAMMIAILADARYRRDLNFLFDKRDCGNTVCNDYADASAEFYRAHRDAIRRCAIVVSDTLAFGMSRMLESYYFDGRVRSFMDIQQARAWLGGGI